MKCKNCSNDVVSTGNRAKEFCSDRCRMQFKRSKANTQSEQIQSEQPKANKSVSELMGEMLDGKPANYGQPDCQCQHCQTNRTNGSKHVINHGQRKGPARLEQLKPNELNRVSLPGDADYVKFVA